MGYFILILLGLGGVTPVAWLVAFWGGRRRPVGRAWPENDVTPRQPASGEATPGSSDAAGAGRRERRRSRSPEIAPKADGQASPT